jgi:hypothetical protein
VVLTCIRIVVFWCLLVPLVRAGDLYVARRRGVDSSTGLTAVGAAPNGPLRTIGRAVRLAKPGDTIHVDPAEGPYPEMVSFHSKSGVVGNPITLDGHGATLIGSDPLQPARWEAVGGGLYRNRTLFGEIKCDDAVLTRYFLVIDREMVRMNRTSKGPKAPFKHPNDLAVREWTYVENEQAFYIRIDAEKALTDYAILVPRRRNGVGVYGDSSHVVVRNVTSTYCINDGFSISSGQGKQIRDLHFENIRAIRCGDDGISAHADCAFSVDGFESRENSTGICDTGKSVTSYNRALIEGCFGCDVFFIVEAAMDGPAWHTMSNSVVVCNAANAVLCVGEGAPTNLCHVALKNVLFVGNRESSALVDVKRNATLTAEQVTFFDLDLVNRGSALTVTRSLFCGMDPPVLLLGRGDTCRLSSNHYAVGYLEMDGVRYGPRTDDQQRHRATTQDHDSTWSAWRGVDTIDHATVSENTAGARLSDDLGAVERGAWAAVRNRVPGGTAAARRAVTQGFDATESFTPLTVGPVGWLDSPGGQWRGFSLAGPTITAGRFLSSPHAVKLTRGGEHLYWECRSVVRAGQDYAVSFAMWREPGAGLVVATRNRFNRDDASVYVSPEGQLMLRNFAGPSAWHRTAILVPEEEWVQLRIQTRNDRDAFTAFLVRKGDDRAQEDQEERPLGFGGQGMTLAIFAPQGPKGASTFVDNVRFAATVEKKTMF